MCLIALLEALNDRNGHWRFYYTNTNMKTDQTVIHLPTVRYNGACKGVKLIFINPSFLIQYLFKLILQKTGIFQTFIRILHNKIEIPFLVYKSSYVTLTTV